MNADDVARAICAAAKETGADPIDVVLGNDRSPGYPNPKMLLVSRARAYAGRALDRVFNHPVITVARPVIAKLIGVNKPSYSSFFSSLDSRPTPWWDNKTYQCVISAIEAGRVQSEPPRAPAVTPAPTPAEGGRKTQPDPPARPPEPKPQANQGTAGGRVLPKATQTRQPIGTLEHEGFRPAPGTYEKVLEDDKAERFSGAYVPVGRPVIKKDDDFLRRAVENTAKMTPPAED